MKYMDLNKLLLECDLVFTAEGSIDFQTPRGKIPAEVAKCAKIWITCHCISGDCW